MKKLRLGFVGVGRVAEVHFNAIENNAELFDFVVVCSRSKDKLAEVKKRFPNINTYTSEDEMIAKERLDIVTLATPNYMHAEQTIKFAGHKINVLLEKPLAMNYMDGLRAVKACEENGVRVFLIHQYRFNPTIQALKSAVDAGRFGKIFMIFSTVFWTHKKEYYENNWHGSKKFDGGMFMTQACHFTDIMQWLIKSDIKKIYGNLKTLHHEIETEDAGIAVVEWMDGTIGNINATVLSHKSTFEGSITVVGEKGAVKIGGDSLNKIEKWDFEEKLSSDEKIFDLSYDITNRYGFGHIPFYKNVANHLLNGEELLLDEREALKSFELLCGIVESGEELRIIHTPMLDN